MVKKTSFPIAARHLKPCPFCGGKAKFGRYDDPIGDDEVRAYVFCTKCPARVFGPAIWRYFENRTLNFRTKTSAFRETMDKWNRREDAAW